MEIEAVKRRRIIMTDIKTDDKRVEEKIGKLRDKKVRIEKALSKNMQNLAQKRFNTSNL